MKYVLNLYDYEELSAEAKAKAQNYLKNDPDRTPENYVWSRYGNHSFFKQYVKPLLFELKGATQSEIAEKIDDILNMRMIQRETAKERERLTYVLDVLRNAKAKPCDNTPDIEIAIQKLNLILNRL